MNTSRSFLLVATLAFAASWAHAEIDPEERANLGVIPEAVREHIRSDFPSLSLPTERDLYGGWSQYQTRYSWLPYLACGDFNDDGFTDYATLLVGKNEWKLVVFQSEAGDYLSLTVQSGNIPGYGLDRYPKALALKTIKKGQAYSPQGTDSLGQYSVKRDSLELQDTNRGTLLLQYANGRYTEFLWDRSPLAGYHVTP